MSGGLASDRLARMHDTMAAHVAAGVAPGVVTAVLRRGEPHVDVIGALDFGGPPMRRDSIFRLASVSKPMTAAVAMMLVEERTLRLDDPVDALLPELADRQVLRGLDAELDDTVPAQRPITVRDLLTLRFGLGTILAAPDQYPILREIADLGLAGFGPPDPAMPHDADEWLRLLGTLPLMYQPGERWLYDTGICVLSVLIERATGQPLEVVLRDRLFEPLGMADTGFSVPASKLDRLTTAYQTNWTTGDLELMDSATESRWAAPPAFANGAAYLVATVDDCLAFGELMLSGGTYGGRRLLARPTVELMATDQLTAAQHDTAGLILGGRGWGLGMSVLRHRDDIGATPGQFGWEGGFGTSWAADPAEELTAVLLSQRMFPSRIYDDFWPSVYQAIDD